MNESSSLAVFIGAIKRYGVVVSKGRVGQSFRLGNAVKKPNPPRLIRVIAQPDQFEPLLYSLEKSLKAFVPHLTVALLLLFASSGLAQHQTLTVSPESSVVGFTLGGSDHETQGTFHVQSGSIDFDRTAPKLSGSVVVAAGSGKTGNDSRDKKMTNVVLDAPHFADVSFAPHGYQGTIAPAGDSTIQVTGTFTLHGTPHELTVPMQIHIDGANCTAKTHFVVPYVQWGLKDPSFFVFKVAKDVDVNLTLVGRLSN